MQMNQNKYRYGSTLSCCFFTLMAVFGQQSPVLNQVYSNSLLLNPANAGLQSYTQVCLNVRDQWSTMPDAPVYYSLSVDGRLRNERSGIAFQLQNDKQAMINNLSGMISYRYTAKINEFHAIRMALSMGLLYNSINLTNLRAQSPYESTLMEHAASKAGFTADAGLVYCYKSFELGFAARQLTNTAYRYNNSGQDEGMVYRLLRYFVASAAYKWKVAKDWDVSPSAILYSAQGMPAYVLASCMVSFQDDYRMGVGYRTDRSLAFSAGVVLYGRLNLGYSFELPVNKYANVIGNTHEVTLGIRLFGRSDPATRREVSRKELEQLVNIVQMQSQDIDALTQQAGKIAGDVQTQQTRYDSQRAEIDSLIRRSMQQRTAVEEARTAAIPVEQLDTVASAEQGRFLVVVGAYSSLGDAKLYQKILEREPGIVTWVHVRQSGQIRYLIYSRIVKTKQEARSEYDRLYNMDVERYKQGDLWLFQLKN
jgi:type IX secretion system PorP/SprF family membrane protein